MRRSLTWRRRSLIPEDFSDSPSPKNFGFDFWDLRFGLGLGIWTGACQLDTKGLGLTLNLVGHRHHHLHVSNVDKEMEVQHCSIVDLKGGLGPNLGLDITDPRSSSASNRKFYGKCKQKFILLLFTLPTALGTKENIVWFPVSVENVLNNCKWRLEPRIDYYS